MEKTCVTMQPDLPESEPAKTCTCESETEQLRNDMSELQERVHKIENLLAEKDKMISKMVANYDSLLQRLDSFEQFRLKGQCNNIDIYNSESELVEAKYNEQSANIKPRQPWAGNGELDHTVIKSKAKRKHKDFIESPSETQKRKNKPKRITEKQVTDCSFSKMEETLMCETNRRGSGQNISDTSILASKELHSDQTWLYKTIDISKNKDKGTIRLSNLNFISSMSKEKETGACQSRKNKNVTDCQISHKTFSSKDKTQNGTNKPHGKKLSLLSKEDHYLLKGDIKSKPEVDNDILTVDQQLHKAAGRSEHWDIQPNDTFLKQYKDVKDESSDEKQVEKTSKPYLVQSPVKYCDESVSHDTHFDDCPTDKKVFDFIGLETSHVVNKTYDENTAKDIITREHTCRVVNEKEVEIQNKPFDHSLNDSQHVELQNPNDETYIVEDTTEKKSVSNTFDIQGKQISYAKLSTNGAYEKPLSQEFMIQNNDGNETTDCKSKDFNTALSEANTETISVQYEMEEINDISAKHIIHQVQYHPQSLEKEQSCNEFLDKPDKHFDLGPHQNSDGEKTNCNETNYNDEQLMKRHIDIENNVTGCESKQGQEMVYDIYIEQTTGCQETPSDFSRGTNTNGGGLNNDTKKDDEIKSSTPTAEQHVSNEKDLTCSKPTTQSPESKLDADKIDEVLVEPIQDKSTTTKQDSESLKKGIIGGPKVWKALADVEQKAARKTLQDLRGAHSVICIDTSVGENALKRINTFVSEFLNGLVEMSGLRELKTEYVALVTLGLETKVQIRFTNDYHRILKCLDNLTFGGSSQIFGGLMMALAAAHSSRYTLVINEDTPFIYTKIIMLTDGRPSYSKPDLAYTSEMDETKAMILQEMETIRKNCHDLFIIPVGDADIEFLKLMVSIADGSILDFTSGRQLSRRQFLSMNIKGQVDLKNNLVDDADGIFSQKDQEDMVDIVEKSQRHTHTRQESFNIRPKGRRKRRKDGNDRFVETRVRERSDSDGSSDSSSRSVSDFFLALPELNEVFKNMRPGDSNSSTFRDADGTLVIGECSRNSGRFHADASKYFKGLYSVGQVLGAVTSTKQEQTAAEQNKKTPKRHPKNKNKMH